MFEGVIKNKQLNTDSVFCYSPALCVVRWWLSSEFMFEPGQCVLVVVDFYHAGPGVINQALILIKSLPVKFRADVFHVGWPAAPGGQMADTGE